MTDLKNWRRPRGRGDVVTCRYVALGHTFFEAPMVIDHDNDRSTGVYVATGTPLRRLGRVDGASLPRVVPPHYFEYTPVTMHPGTREHGPSLIVWRPGRAHAVHIHWRGDSWELDGYYVNLQAPMTETVAGFETTDLFLDIVVDADLNWQWKDEDELEEAVAVGRLTVTEADAVRREGERVVAGIEARRWPFDGTFDDWRPDPCWPVPPMPDDWNSE